MGITIQMARKLHWVDNAEELVGVEIKMHCCHCGWHYGFEVATDSEFVRDNCKRDINGYYIPVSHQGYCNMHDYYEDGNEY